MFWAIYKQAVAIIYTVIWDKTYMIKLQSAITRGRLQVSTQYSTNSMWLVSSYFSMIWESYLMALQSSLEILQELICSKKIDTETHIWYSFVNKSLMLKYDLT